tara:strand:+ start:743 stop:1015 length:273 start_codon:yes stop_codon:yes gene_type:complete
MPIGVSITKKIINIIKGAIIDPSNSPNFTQDLFSGVKIFESNKPKIKNNNDTTSDHNRIDSSLSKGQQAIIKNIIENNSPKLLLLAFFCM